MRVSIWICRLRTHVRVLKILAISHGQDISNRDEQQRSREQGPTSKATNSPDGLSGCRGADGATHRNKNISSGFQKCVSGSHCVSSLARCSAVLDNYLGIVCSAALHAVREQLPVLGGWAGRCFSAPRLLLAAEVVSSECSAAGYLRSAAKKGKGAK